MLLASQINSTSLEIQNPFEVLKETLPVSLVSPRGINSQGDTREKPLIQVTWSHDLLALTLRLLFTSDICLLVSCWGIFSPVMLLETRVFQRLTYIKETRTRNV